MWLSKVAALAFFVGATGSMSAAPALAASDCPILVELADWERIRPATLALLPGEVAYFRSRCAAR
jgi:hypothetical protein